MFITTSLMSRCCELSKCQAFHSMRLISSVPLCRRKKQWSRESNLPSISQLVSGQAGIQTWVCHHQVPTPTLGSSLLLESAISRVWGGGLSAVLKGPRTAQSLGDLEQIPGSFGLSVLIHKIKMFYWTVSKTSCGNM